MDRLKAVATYVCAHKTTVYATAVALLALVSHFTDGVPAEAILAVVRAALGV